MAKKHRPRETPRTAPAPRPVIDLDKPPYPRLAVVALFLLPLVFYGRVLFGNVLLFGTDFIGAGGYAAHEFMASYIRRHLAIAFWQPQILCGQPTVAAFFGDMFYPTIFFRLFLPVHIVWAWTFYLHTALAGVGTYLFLKELKLNTAAAFLAGVAYMFSGSLLTLAYAGHDGRLIGSALMPLALFWLARGVDQRRLLPFLFSGLTVGLQLLSGHIQKVYYTGLLLLGYFIFALVRTVRQEKTPAPGLRLVFYFIIGMVFAGCFAAVQYLPIYGNLPYGARGGERGYEFATSWSMPIAEIFDLFTPNFSGGLGHYWGKNPFKLHSEYLGILPLLFALLGIVRLWKKPEVKFFVFTLGLAILFAWGGNTPFYRLPYHLLPGLAKFRGPGMIFFIAAFSIAVLAGYGVNYSIEDSKRSSGKTHFPPILIYAGAGLGLFFLLALTGPRVLAGIFNPGPRLAEFEANYPDLTRGLLFACCIWAVGCLLLLSLLRNRLSPRSLAIAAATVMTLDTGSALRLWNDRTGYIRTLPAPETYFAPDEVVRFLKADTTLYRVLPLNYERSDEGELWLHNIFSTGGQMPNPLQTYQDLIGAGKSVMFQANNLLNPNFMNLLNVKYIITYNLPEDVSRFDASTQNIINGLKRYFSSPQFSKVFTGVRYSIYQNARCLPRAFLAPAWEVVANKDALLERLAQPGFNPAQTVLLYRDPGLPPSGDPSAGRAEVLTYDANRITVHAQLNATGLLVLSENYHPDWKVTVDGKPAPLLQAFHTLRAVALTPGEHLIEFRYISPHFRLGSLLTLGSLGFLVLVALVQTLLDRSGNRHKPVNAR